MTTRGILKFLGVVGICAAISGTFYFFYAQDAGTIGYDSGSAHSIIG
jgi:hypothetical protein